MLDATLRPFKDALFVPLTVPIPRFLSPNFLTFLAFITGLACCYYATLLNTPCSVTFWIANRALDCLDGALARRRNQTTDLGAFLDLLGDFIIYSLIPIACAFGVAENADAKTSGGISSNTTWMDSIASRTLSKTSNATLKSTFWLSVAAVEASFHINNFVLFFIAALLERRIAGQRKDAATNLMLVAARPALIEGFESGVFFSLMLLKPEHLEPLCWSMTALVGFGTLQRVGWLIRALGRDVILEKAEAR